MARLIYTALSSLDGFIEDTHGGFDWAAPDEEAHAFINNLQRAAGTYLYGRRMYEIMIFWETAADLADAPPFIREFAQLWVTVDKVVYSRTLEKVSTRRTRIERSFDPSGIRQLKATAEKDIFIGGPNLAAHAFRAGLVDECQLFLAPVIVGAGKQSLPDDVRIDLGLLEQRRFGSGMVYLRYQVKQEKASETDLR